jgi:hypothetical protein
MTLKGRHWVMLWLVAALGTLMAVAWRQQRGYATAQQLRTARDERGSLEAQRGELERRIRTAASRQVLVPRAGERLGLHEPRAQEMTVLVVPADLPGGLPAEALTAPRTDTVRTVPVRPRATARAPARRPTQDRARPAPARTTRRP